MDFPRVLCLAIIAYTSTLIARTVDAADSSVVCPKTNCGWCSSQRIKANCKSLCVTQCKGSTAGGDDSDGGDDDEEKQAPKSKHKTAIEKEEPATTEKPTTTQKAGSTTAAGASNTKKPKNGKKAKGTSSPGNGKKKSTAQATTAPTTITQRPTPAATAAHATTNARRKSKKSQNGNGVKNTKATQSPVKSDQKTITSSRTGSTSTGGGSGKFKPKVPLAAANDRFKACCKDIKGFPAGCLKLCHYNVKKAEAKEALASGDCTLDRMQQYIFCASDGNDNSDCCQTKHVFDGRPQCKPFCRKDASGLSVITQKHFKCGAYLETIMGCHWSGLK